MLIVANLHSFIGSLVHIAGFAFVLFVLSLLWMVIEGVGSFFRSRDGKQSKETAKSSPTVVPVMTYPPSDGLPEEELVVIASAVALMLGQRKHRLVSIRSSGTDWSREGRRQLLQSHKI